MRATRGAGRAAISAGDPRAPPGASPTRYGAADRVQGAHLVFRRGRGCAAAGTTTLARVVVMSIVGGGNRLDRARTAAQGLCDQCDHYDLHAHARPPPTTLGGGSPELASAIAAG